MRYHFPDHPETELYKDLCEKYKQLSQEQMQKQEEIIRKKSAIVNKERRLDKDFENRLKSLDLEEVEGEEST
jgi:hypothetical protein